MTGPEHYAEAERLREAARDSMNQDHMQMAAYFNQAAQAHATLAQTAATIDANIADRALTAPAWGEVLS
jgi:hypothetical protein